MRSRTFSTMTNKKNHMTNNDLQSTIQKTKDGATRTPPLLRVIAGFPERKVVPVPLAAPAQS